jgi:hypothetical protein
MKQNIMIPIFLILFVIFLIFICIFIQFLLIPYRVGKIIRQINKL